MSERATEVGRIRDSSERAAQLARRVEDLLGRAQQDSLERRVSDEAELLIALRELTEAAAAARDATGERADARREADALRRRQRGGGERLACLL